MTPTSTDRDFTHTRTTLAPLTPVSTGFFSVSDAAAMTSTGQETIRRAIRAGLIPAYGTRGRTRVRLSDVLPNYVPQRKQQPVVAPM